MMTEQIVLGLGNNVDYEVYWDSTIIERLIREWDITWEELATTRPIRTCRELLISILQFLRNGSGGERYVNSVEPIIQLAQHVTFKITLGGTGVRAAIAMNRLGYRPTIHLVTVNDDILELLPDECHWVCSNNSKSLYPHLIIQFREGTRVEVGNMIVEAPKANRIIYVHDPDNSELRISPDFASTASQSHLVLISGLNAITERMHLLKRLTELRQILSSLSTDTIVFYEDACFHERGFGIKSVRFLMDSIKIHSLNEDELRDYLCRDVQMLDPYDVWNAISELQALVPVPVSVIHTEHWALAYSRHEAKQFFSALREGIIMATTRLRFGDDFTLSQYEETTRLPEDHRSKTFAQRLTEIGNGTVCCIPSFHVKQMEVTTIGLGDAFVGGFLSKIIEGTAH